MNSSPVSIVEKIVGVCVFCVGEEGDEVLYGTSDGKLGLVQIGR